MAINASIQLLRGTELAFATENPILKDGQPAYSTNLKKLKIGDGVSAWSDLEYINIPYDELVIILSDYLTASQISTMLESYVAQADLDNAIEVHTGLQNPHGTTLEDVRSAGASVSGDINMSGNRLMNLAEPASNNEPIRKIDFDSYVNTVGRQRGEIDCSTNPNYPASNAGDRWEVTAAGKIGGASGISVSVYDEIVCKTDSAAGNHATVGSNFYVIQGNIERATESTSGYLMLASQSDAEGEVDDEKAMTALKVKKWWDKVKSAAITFADAITFTSAPIFSSGTANKFVKLGASKQLTSADIVCNDISDAGNLGKTILGLTRSSAVRYLRENADGSVTMISLAQLKADLGIHSIVTIQNDVSNSATDTLADVTGLAFPVTAGKTYKFRFVIAYTASSTAVGSRWTINGPAITSLSYRSMYTNSATAQTLNTALSAYQLPAASNATSGAGNGNIAIIEGIITPSASGNVQCQFACEINTGTITAKAGSFVEYQELF